MQSKNIVKAPARARSACGLGGLVALPLAMLASSAAAEQPPQPPQQTCAVHPAGAPRVIRFGACVRSTLDAQDAQLPAEADGIPAMPYEDWTLTLRAGDTVRIEMDAIVPDQPAQPEPVAAADTHDHDMLFGFDTYLELRRANVAEALETNDDRPGSLNSRIDFTATEAGDYIVRARPLWDAGAGEYTLSVGAAPPPPVALPLADGVTRLTLGPETPESELMPDFRGALYAFQGTAGERVRISGSSATSMLMMDLAGPGGTDEGSFASAFQDPVEPAGATAARGEAVMLAVLPQTGRYLLQLFVPEAAEPTPIVLSLERGRAAPARGPRTLRLGEAVDGEIGLNSTLISDPNTTGGQAFAELYELAVRANQPVSVVIQAPGSMTMVEAGVMSPLGFATAVSGDSGTPLLLTPAQNGTIWLRVRPFGNGGGRFRLTVSPAGAPPAQ